MDNEEVKKAIQTLIDYTQNIRCSECILKNTCSRSFSECPKIWELPAA